jgi:LPXTG-motif cell wall-anchored protein
LTGSFTALSDQTVIFGLSGLTAPSDLTYDLSFSLDQAASAPSGLTPAAAGLAAASGLGFLRRRKRKR